MLESRPIDTGAMKREIDRGRVVVVAGFQGCKSEWEGTTLGKRWSELSAGG